MCDSVNKVEHVKTKEEYIKAAVGRIENDTDQRSAAKELAAHIDDRIQYYKDIGYDDATAAQKAVEQMGDPDSVSIALARLHPEGRIWTAVLAVLMFAIALASFWLYEMWSLSDGELGFGIAEFLLLLCFIGLSGFGKRRGNRFLCALPTVVFPLTYGFYLMLAMDVHAPICSPIVLEFFCLITGDFACLGTFTNVGRISVAPWLSFTTYVFYILIFVLLLSALISTCTLCKPNYSFFDKKASRIISIIQKSLLFILVLIIVISPFCAQSGDYLKPLGCEPSDFSAVVILQSDRPCSIEEVTKEDILIFHANWDWSDYIFCWDTYEKDTKFAFDVDGESVRVACGHKLEYVFEIFTICPEITKPYLYVGFINEWAPENASRDIHWDNLSDFITLTEADWQETESFDTVRAAVDSFNCVEVVVNAS